MADRTSIASSEMDPLQVFSGGIAVAAAAAVTTYFARNTRPSARQDGQTMVVEYDRTKKVFVIVFWVFTAFGSLAAVFAPPSERAMAIGIVSIFFLLVLSLHLEFFYIRIRYDSEGLHLASPWRRHRFVPWSAITEARFSRALQWYVVSTTDCGSIHLHVYLSGLQSLLDELSSRGVSVPPRFSFSNARKS